MKITHEMFIAEMRRKVALVRELRALLATHLNASGGTLSALTLALEAAEREAEAQSWTDWRDWENCLKTEPEN